MHPPSDGIRSVMAGENGPSIFQDLMRFKPDGMTPNGWAVKAGVSRTVWADIRRHGNPSRRTLEKLLAAAGSSIAEFEALRVGHAPPSAYAAAGHLRDSPGLNWTSAPAPPLPLIASNAGGEWGAPGSQIELTEVRPEQLIDRLVRPASLANDRGAYAMAVAGDSMWPRFRTGRRVAISPKSRIANGDDVLVRLRRKPGEETDRQLALLKVLVRFTGHYLELRQFNPDRTFRVEAADVLELHKVVGELF
jgi:phage repressor protein C with HTH and peptisase S24 domain